MVGTALFTNKNRSGVPAPAQEIRGNASEVVGHHENVKKCGEKYLIFDADDFGASIRVNRGTVEAYEQGFLTSASLGVRLPTADGTKLSPS